MEKESTESSRPSTPSLVEQVYRQVWDEFYDWEQEESALSIKSLDILHDSGSALRLLEDDEIETNANRGDYFGNCCFPKVDSDECVVKLRSSQKHIYTFDIFQAGTPDPIKPAPIYESCTPSLVNIGPRRYQVPHDETMGFFPLIEDETFDQEKYADFFKFLAWDQDQDQDPDLEQIWLETARRLINMDMTIERIDRTGILPVLHNELFGVLMVHMQRDTLSWVKRQEAQGVKPINEYFQKVFQEQKFDERVLLSEKTFCANLNCIMDSCRTHGETSSRFMSIEPMAVKTSYDLLQEVSTTCGGSCFKTLMMNNLDNHGLAWEDKDVDKLKCILKVCPDTLPCELKYACRKPCFEIFLWRKIILPDSVVEQQRERTEKAMLSNKKRRPYLNKSGWNHLYLPCRHEGACIKNEYCECWKLGVYCTRACQCPATCNQRWKGCKCKAIGKQKACRLDKPKCPCVKARLECDPELCKGCSASACTYSKEPRFYYKNKTQTCFVGVELNGTPSCLNSSMQHVRRKRIIVAPSQTHGLGAFILESVKKHSLISEYNGYTYDKLEDLQAIEHNKRNYFFDAESHTLDAISVANETRFPNEAKDNPREGQKKSNCHTKTILVNGQWRVGIYSSQDLREYEEILFDYGSHFEMFN